MSLKAHLVRALEADDQEQAKGLAADLILLARKGNASAIKTLTERIDGPVTQRIHVTNVDVFAAFGAAMREVGIDQATAEAVFAAAERVLDPSGLRGTEDRERGTVLGEVEEEIDDGDVDGG